jgi:BlaR1 peptidase M56
MGHLFDVSLPGISSRSLAIAALASLCLWRVKSAALKHAVWTVVMAGMLLQLLLSPVLPPLPLPVLRPVELAAVPGPVTNAPMPAPPQPTGFPVLPSLYIAGVAFFAAQLLRAFVFTRRLIRRAERIGLRLFQSPEIAVPVTTGSKILLPIDWPGWDAAKLRAVLAHEESHVRRRDSFVALLARVNCCIFWFHPLAWWLERELARLAEQACDDAALAATQDRRQYARTLLDMARAVHHSHGRFLTAGMAKEANVETRMNRILDESRRIPKAVGKVGWTALVSVAAPLIYFAAAVQLTPAQTLMQIPAPAAPAPPRLIAQAAPAPAAPALEQPTPAARATPASEPATPQELAVGKPGLPSYTYFPKVYNGRNKTFFFFAPQVPVLEPQPLKIAVDVSAPGSAGITIPIPGDTGDSDLFAQLRDSNGKDVLYTRLSHATGVKTIQVPLAPGQYEFKVLVRNNLDGRVGTSVTEFEVK